FLLLIEHAALSTHFPYTTLFRSHFGKSHGFVGFVIEVQGGAVVRLITDETIKSDNGAVFRGPDDAGQRNRVDGFSHQLKDVIVGQCRHGDASAAAHRRKKRNLVAGTEGSVPGGEFLVARSDYRRTVLCELRIARRVKSEELLDRGGIGELGGILGVAGEVLEAPEKEDRHANRL